MELYYTELKTTAIATGTELLYSHYFTCIKTTLYVSVFETIIHLVL